MVSDHIPEMSAWMAAAGVAELELTGPDTRLYLRLNGEVCSPDIQPGHADDDADPVETIAAPAAGIFLNQHPARATPLVTDGSEVRAGDLVGLLQIGSLLVPVVMPKAGIVTDILVPSGEIVGYGTKLVEFERLET
jgi:acetyl-CoA carboxylase biotin carboxyl carrier protein